MYTTTDNGYSVQFTESMRKCSDGQIRGVFEAEDGTTGVIVSGDFLPDAKFEADEYVQAIKEIPAFAHYERPDPDQDEDDADD